MSRTAKIIIFSLVLLVAIINKQTNTSVNSISKQSTTTNKKDLNKPNELDELLKTENNVKFIYEYENIIFSQEEVDRRAYDLGESTDEYLKRNPSIKKIKVNPSKTTNKSDNCLKTTNITGKPLCLPSVDGLVECSNDSIIEFFSNLLKGENEISIAWYFNGKNCESIDNKISEGKFDYFKVWTTTQFVNRNNQKNDFNEFESYFKNNDWSFLFNWSIEEKVKKYINKEISGDAPILLEFHKPPNDNIFSAIFLMKIITGNTESIVISSTNIIKINDRTYFYALYLPYDGITSIKGLKAKSDYFGLKLLSVNNE